MGGEVKHLVGDVNHFFSEYESSFNALLKFKDGTSGFLCTNRAVGKRIHTFEMHAKGISAFINPDREAQIYVDNIEEPTIITSTEAAQSEDRVKYYGFYDENRHFIDCLINDSKPEAVSKTRRRQWN